MRRHGRVSIGIAALFAAALLLAHGPAAAQDRRSDKFMDSVNDLVTSIQNKAKRVTTEQRKSAARNFKALLKTKKPVPVAGSETPSSEPAVAAQAAAPVTMAMPAAEIPHYFGPYPNWAYSPLPEGPVTSIEIVDGGHDYSAPTVTITDAYNRGSGAEATATVDPASGAITDISVTAQGTGYSAPVVTITDPTGEDAAAEADIGGALSGGIRKFIDKMPGVGQANANLLGQYLPVAVADTQAYAGSDYYEIAVVEYAEKMHTDLPPTVIRGYVQLETNNNSGVSKHIALQNPDGSAILKADGSQAYAVDNPHYLGPIIVAKRDVPARIKFSNLLPTGAGGNLFIPVDTTVMGAGHGPYGMNPPVGDMHYTQNRANVHLHGNNSVWISDGTPHQWVTPAGEITSYPEGVSVQNVPDMPDPGDGSVTLFYTNAHSARLMFYHDHSYGITRLNVYGGEAAGYLLTDQVEQDMINGTNSTGINPNSKRVLPDTGIPLIIQDKTFIDANTMVSQDPTWMWGTGMMDEMTGRRAFKTGDLWYPHVYMPAQNPYDESGANPFGRWHYAPWFWPPATDLKYPPVPNPYYDTQNAPWEPPEIPATPNPSMPGEAFMDTPVVNGTAYPYIEVEPKAYRFRILNACNDRFWNLQLYQAYDPATNAIGTGTEVKMVPATKTAGYPSGWPTDGREGGVPDPATIGPSFIQIGTEGGFLPAPAVVTNQPVTWNLNPTSFNFGNVDKHALLLGTAERADVIIDFSKYAGKTLILYNDAPAAFPALDPRYDYYTGNPGQTDTGGAPSTQPGYGPNTRTIMQIRVKASAPAAAYDIASLKSVFAKTAFKRGVFEVSQDQIIIPQGFYNSAYNAVLPTSATQAYVQLNEFSKTFTPLNASAPVTLPLQPKAIQDEMGEAYDIEYGRMSGMLGLELPASQAGVQNFMLYPYPSPLVEVIKGSLTGSQIGSLADGTQIWKITHNGVDTHTIHTHLFNAQLINRVAWDGAMIPPDPNELGWKETFRVNPLEHTIIAFRPFIPQAPFKVPNSVRLIDPTMPEGHEIMGPLGGFKDPLGNPVTVMNHMVNFGWEYVYHCHLLAHEEMDMMHAVGFAVPPEAPTNLAAVSSGNVATLNWTDNSLSETGFTVQRAANDTFTTGLVSFKLGADVVAYVDNTISSDQKYYYRVFATNVVGDAELYAAASFPTITVDSAFSNTVSVGMPLQPPAAPSTLRIMQVERRSIELAWNDNSNNETGFIIQRATNSSFTSGLRTFTVGANIKTFNDTGLSSFTRYYYRVRAFNSQGNSAYSNTVDARTRLF